jgi:spore maturation protein CgeB
MGIVGKIGDVFHKIDYHTSDAPEIKGKRFEDHVENLFSKHYFKIIEKTHSFKTNSDRYVESSKNPDFIFEYVPTKEQFAVECKFRTRLNRQNQLEWSYPAQLKRYKEFACDRKMPVYIVVGLELTLIDENDPDYEKIESYMFNIPLEAAKYPALFESVFAKYERDYDKPFFWKKGVLS